MDGVIPIVFPNTYPLDRELSDGQRYPSFEQTWPGLLPAQLPVLEGGGGEWSEEKESQLCARQTKLPAMQATKRIPPVIVGSLSSPKQLNVAFNHFSTGWHPLAKYDTVLINLVTFWTWYLVWTDTHRTSSVESGLTTHQRHWEPEKENNDIVETGINY